MIDELYAEKKKMRLTSPGSPGGVSQTPTSPGSPGGVLQTPPTSPGSPPGGLSTLDDSLFQSLFGDPASPVYIRRCLPGLLCIRRLVWFGLPCIRRCLPGLLCIRRLVWFGLPCIRRCLPRLMWISRIKKINTII